MVLFYIVILFVIPEMLVSKSFKVGVKIAYRKLLYYVDKSSPMLSHNSHRSANLTFLVSNKELDHLWKEKKNKYLNNLQVWSTNLIFRCYLICQSSKTTETLLRSLAYIYVVDVVDVPSHYNITRIKHTSLQKQCCIPRLNNYIYFVSDQFKIH